MFHFVLKNDQTFEIKVIFFRGYFQVSSFPQNVAILLLHFRLSVVEKSNLFARRSGGVRPIKIDRMPRRKTQPITLDDIAHVNQCILQGSGIPPG